jgi:hypothetical protein
MHSVTDRPPSGSEPERGEATKPLHYPCLLGWAIAFPDGSRSSGFCVLGTAEAYDSTKEELESQARITGGRLATFKPLRPVHIARQAVAVRVCRRHGERGADELFCGLCRDKTVLAGLKDSGTSTSK